MNVVDNDGTMKGNKTQGGFCWYRLIFINSGSETEISVNIDDLVGVLKRLIRHTPVFPPSISSRT